MDELKNLNGNGGLLNDTTDENKVRIDFESIESTESNIPLEERFGTVQENEDVQSAEVNVEFEKQPQDVQPEPQPVKVPVQPPVAPVPVQQPPVQQKTKKAKKKKSPEEKKAKRAKRNKRFGIFVRIFVITILSVATLWSVAYTVDHVLAAQGYPPIFVISEKTYDISYLADENEILKSKGEDEMLAYSYECLGYKIQHVYDESCNPEVDFVWAGEKGAVDHLFDQGKLFEREN